MLEQHLSKCMIGALDHRVALLGRIGTILLVAHDPENARDLRVKTSRAGQRTAQHDLSLDVQSDSRDSATSSCSWSETRSRDS